MTLTEQLLKAYEDSGYSWYVICRKAGVSDSVVSRWRSRGGSLNLSTADKLYEAIGLLVASGYVTPKRGRS